MNEGLKKKSGTQNLHKFCYFVFAKLIILYQNKILKRKESHFPKFIDQLTLESN